MARRRPVGKMVMWCSECKAYFATTPETFRWICPVCKSYTAVLRCNRCGYEWRPRSGKVPKSCPQCDSQYWNRQRMIPMDRREKE